MNAYQRASMLIMIVFLAGCQTAPSAECAFWSDPPYTDNDIDMISEPFARWLDRTTGAAKKIC